MRRFPDSVSLVSIILPSAALIQPVSYVFPSCVKELEGYAFKLPCSSTKVSVSTTATIELPSREIIDLVSSSAEILDKVSLLAKIPISKALDIASSAFRSVN